MLYCFLVPIVSTDTRADIRALASSVRDFISGRDQRSDGGSGRYVWSVNNQVLESAASPGGKIVEVDAMGVIGYGSDVSAGVLATIGELESIARLVQTVAFNPALASRGDVEARLWQRARDLGASRVWMMRPGGDFDVQTVVALGAKFEGIR